MFDPTTRRGAAIVIARRRASPSSTCDDLRVLDTCLPRFRARNRPPTVPRRVENGWFSGDRTGFWGTRASAESPTQQGFSGFTKAEADLQDDHSYQFNVRRSDTVIDATSSRCPVRYTNSADFDTEQNCKFVQRQFRIFLVTTKDIQAGVEFLAFYNHD